MVQVHRLLGKMVVQEFTVDLNKPLVFQVCFALSCFFVMIVVNLRAFVK